jgi:hypothetical protein
MFLFAVFIVPYFGSLANSIAKADVVIRDTLTMPIDTRVGSGNSMVSFRHPYTLGAIGNRFTGFGFVGNGNPLSKIQFAVQYVDAAPGGGLNQGDIQNLQWQAALYLDGTRFNAAGVFLPWQQFEGAPDNHAMVSPSSADWNSPIGTHVSSNVSVNGLNTYQVEFDLSDLGWLTTKNQFSVIAITPVNIDNGQSIRTFIAQSNYTGDSLGFTDYADWPSNANWLYTQSNGPGNPDFIYRHHKYALNVRYNWEDAYDGRYAAVRITTQSVPEPNSILLICSTTALVCGLKRRKRY